MYGAYERDWYKISSFDPIITAFDTNDYDLATSMLTNESNINRLVYRDLNMIHYILRGIDDSVSYTKIRFILLLLSHGIDVDLCDARGVSAREKLRILGYQIDRKYLVYKCSSSLIDSKLSDDDFIDI